MTPQTKESLLQHLLDQKYIKDKSSFNKFISCLHEDFLEQLKGDMAYRKGQ